MAEASIDVAPGLIDEAGVGMGSAVGLDAAVGVDAAAWVEDPSTAVPEQAAATNSDADMASDRAFVPRNAYLVILDLPRLSFTFTGLAAM